MTVPIDLSPVALTIGDFPLRWYALTAITAIAPAILMVRRGAARLGIPVELVEDGGAG